MRKFRVKQDCFCEHYIHEKTFYPRPWLVEMKLFKGDEVKLEKEWYNFYGRYMRVTKDGKSYDILPENLEEIK